MSTLRRQPPWKSREGFQWAFHDMTPQYSECMHWLHAATCDIPHMFTYWQMISHCDTQYLTSHAGCRDVGKRRRWTNCASSTSFRENDLQRLLAKYLQIISRHPLFDMFKLSLTRTFVVCLSMFNFYLLRSARPSVCLSVSLSARISRKPHVQISPNVLYVLTVALARASC